jgi:hypothetical protein
MSRSVAFPQLYPVVALICTTLDRLQIAYLICGSVAAHLHGYQARETHDVDLLADVQPRHVTRLATALQPDFANAEPRIVNEALDHARLWRSGTPTASAPSINVVYRAIPTLHADIFLPSGADQSAEQRWEREQFSNRVRIVGPDQQPI